MKERRFVVYFHFTNDTNELFYVGEGTLNRAHSKFSRNKYWRNKVNKHLGFRVLIIADNLTKIEAETLEKELIKANKNKGLVNLCEGTMFGSHWLVGKPKEMHPMFGKKSPNASKRMKKWNAQRSGKNSPTYGKKRPDLSERNKLAKFKRRYKKVICIETGEIFNSVKDVNRKFGSGDVSRAVRKNYAINKHHFIYCP